MKTSVKPKKVVESEPVPPFIKGFVVFLLLLIPILGYFILRSDPIIYSNNVAKDDVAVKQVQAFAAFIEKKPELAIKRIPHFEEKPATPPREQVSPEQKEQAKERVNDLVDIWRTHPPVYDQQWRNQVEKLFDLVEQTRSEEALDLVRTQVLTARMSADDLNREQADKWFSRYVALEKREDKLQEMTEFFKEKVLDRVDQDERKKRESP